MGEAFRAITTIGVFLAFVAAIAFTFGVGFGFTAGFASRAAVNVAGALL